MSTRSARGSKSQGTTATQPAATANPAAASPAPPRPVTDPADEHAQDLVDQRARLRSLSARHAKAVKLRDSIRARAKKLEEDHAEYRRFVQDRNRKLVQESRDFRAAETDAQTEMGEIPDLEAAIARIQAELGEG